MSPELFAALAGSGVLGAVGSAVLAVLRARSEAKSAEAQVVEVVHGVYGGTIDMLRVEIEDHRRQLMALQEEMWHVNAENNRLRARVAFLEAWIIRRGLEVPVEGAEGG